MANYKIIDADGHVRESNAGMREFLEPRWQRRNLFPNDEWDRDLRGKLGQKPENPKDQLAAMDEDGIDVMVCIQPQVCMSRRCTKKTTHRGDPGLQRLALPFLQNRYGALEVRRAAGAAGPQSGRRRVGPGGQRARRGGRRVADILPQMPDFATASTIRFTPPPRVSASGSAFTPAPPPIRWAASASASFFRPIRSIIRPSR